MTPKKTLAGFGATVILMGGIDASALAETPLDRTESVANEIVKAKQISNVVETTLPWKDQTGIKVKYDMGEPTLSEKFKDKRNKEVITETVDFGDGGFKVDILLNEKPNTNVFCYQIEGAENYDFFYQPPLTAEEIAEGAERPENIQGSYAVYHKTLKNHREGSENYATGKVMHIPRPQVWEMNNQASTTEWADLSYNEKDGLCVTVRQGFVNKATYPVRVDPTFGYTSIGATTVATGVGDTTRANTDTPSLYTAATGDTITQFSVYGSATGDCALSLYTWNGTVPTSRFAAGTTVSIGSGAAWYNSATISQSPSAGTTYVTALDLYVSASWTARYDAVGTNSIGASSALPTTWSQVNSITRNYSYYTTYTTTATSTPTDTIMLID